MDTIILYLKKSLHSKLFKGDTIILKKEMMQEKPKTIETEIPYSKKIELAFNKNKGFHYRKIIGGTINFSVDSDSDSERMARPNKFKLQGGSLVGDVARSVGHRIVHEGLPKIGAFLGASSASLIGAPELAVLGAQGGAYLGEQAARKFTEISGVGIKVRKMGLERTGKNAFRVVHRSK